MKFLLKMIPWAIVGLSIFQSTLFAASSISEQRTLDFYVDPSSIAVGEGKYSFEYQKASDVYGDTRLTLNRYLGLLEDSLSDYERARSWIVTYKLATVISGSLAKLTMDSLLTVAKVKKFGGMVSLKEGRSVDHIKLFSGFKKFPLTSGNTKMTFSTYFFNVNRGRSNQAQFRKFKLGNEHLDPQLKVIVGVKGNNVDEDAWPYFGSSNVFKFYELSGGRVLIISEILMALDGKAFRSNLLTRKTVKKSSILAAENFLKLVDLQ
ncbi:MAG: hypothetical protein HOE90_14035 [Bacteriovoracaceae bacterium]|jgi:hypothetical protein|nr:hypothetical protein [Bacteriovoracaceae bacterium]